jgi:hypothetical protein
MRPTVALSAKWVWVVSFDVRGASLPGAADGKVKDLRDGTERVDISLLREARTSLDERGWNLEADESGGQRRDRTADAGLFRAALYH